MRNTILKKKLKAKEFTLGSWVTINHPSIIEIMSNKGFEWLVLDIEHSSFDFEDIKNLIAHIQNNNMAALVRVYANDEVVIKRVMDAGADGIIVPMIKSNKDIEKVKDFLYYPPLGKRGVGLNRAQKYGEGFDEYKKWLNESAVFIAQIEHIESIKNIDEILSNEIVDGLIVGPYDLSASMGFPGEYNRQDVKNALDKFEEAGKKSNKAIGFHVVPPKSELILEKYKLGYNFIAFSLDFYFLSDVIKTEMKKIIEEII
ncbi:MAG: HpcH/HpaI aldolase family protein [Stygiobacter sp.]